MHITILGAGAMGCLYGGQLKQAGYDVTLVDVWQEHIDTINKNGLKLEVDGKVGNIRLLACTAAELEQQTGLVIVFTKSIQSLQALEEIKKTLTPDTIFLTLQNGLGNIEKINQFAPLSKIIVGVTTIPAELLGPGSAHSKGQGINTIIAADGNINKDLKLVQAMLQKSGQHTDISPDAITSIWEKVAFNAAANSLCAILRLTAGQLGANPDGRELAFAIIREAATVAAAKGIPVSADKVISMLSESFERHFDHLPSTLQDVLAKRTTEIESINGEVVRQGKAAGVDTPATELLYKLVKITQEVYSVQVPYQ